MTDRRLFIQSFLSALTALYLPSTSRASPAVQTPLLLLAPSNDELRTTIKEVIYKDPQFRIIGVGDAGGNTVRHMCACGVQGIELICADSNASTLHHNGAHKTIQLGASGLPISRPICGRIATRKAEAEIRSAIQGTDMLFVTTNLGSGTGCGAAPEIARIAKNMGIMTVGLVTMPFDWEGPGRYGNAKAGLSELEASVDSLIVLDYEKLGDKFLSVSTMEDIVTHGNDLLSNAINGIVQVVNSNSSISIDFVDLQNIMSTPGKTSIGTAVASGPDRARLAAEQALASPFFEGTHLSEAKGVLVLIAASKGSLRLSEFKLAMNAIRANTSMDTHVLYGTLDDESLDNKLKITVVATGFTSGI